MRRWRTQHNTPKQSGAVLQHSARVIYTLIAQHDGRRIILGTHSSNHSLSLLSKELQIIQNNGHQCVLTLGWHSNSLPRGFELSLHFHQYVLCTLLTL